LAEQVAKLDVNILLLASEENAKEGRTKEEVRIVKSITEVMTRIDTRGGRRDYKEGGVEGLARLELVMNT
jgi:hypothetical protein